MNAETHSTSSGQAKICQNCKKPFTIEPEDFGFYEQIKVPAPTFCPDCRAARRMLWRNERTYYKRKCNAPGHTEEIISLHAPDAPFTIYDQAYWWSDSWNPLDYGCEYDFSKSFFQQYRGLLERIPLIALSNTSSVNSDYSSSAAWNKDCYLVSGGGWNEKVSYANRMVKDKDSLDLYIVDSSELCYDDSYCHGSYHLLYSRYCESCNNSAFLYNCRNCQDCIGCTNLRNKQYCVLNEQYTKDEYQKKLKELDFGSWKNVNNFKDKFYSDIYLTTIHKYADLVNCVNSTGDHLRNARDCKNCFDFSGDGAERCRYVNWSGFNGKDLYDCGPGAGWESQLLYESVDVNSSSRITGGVVVYDSHDVWYSTHTHGSGNIFGCYGVRNKQYCILNKEYSKEEYEALLDKIKKHMNEVPYVDKQGRKYGFGEFFPPEIAPFAYIETVAQEYFPLTPSDAAVKGYDWRKSEDRNYTVTILPNDLPDHIRIVSDAITQEVVGCAHGGKCNEQCTTAFRILPEELAFYRKMNIPLPRLCPNCRHYGRLKERTPMNLWHRKCQCAGGKSENGVYQNTVSHQHGAGKCPNEFETSYGPERKEIVYCEQCYQAEVV